MNRVPYIAISTLVLCLTASGASVAPEPKDADAAGIRAAAAGWDMAYEMDPTTGRYALQGFASPDGKVVPFAKGQRAYTADPYTGKLTRLIPGQVLSSTIAEGGAGPTDGKPSFAIGGHAD